MPVPTIAPNAKPGFPFSSPTHSFNGQPRPLAVALPRVQEAIDSLIRTQAFDMYERAAIRERVKLVVADLPALVVILQEVTATKEERWPATLEREAVYRELDLLVNHACFTRDQRAKAREFAKKNRRSKVDLERMLARCKEIHAELAPAIDAKAAEEAEAARLFQVAREEEQAALVEKGREQAATAAATTTYRVAYQAGERWHNYPRRELVAYHFAKVVFSSGYQHEVTLEVGAADVLTDEQVAAAVAANNEAVAYVYSRVAHPRFVYARYKGDYVNLYYQDSTSPSGVYLGGGAQNCQLVDFCSGLAKRRAYIGSPTEMLRN